MYLSCNLSTNTDLKGSYKYISSQKSSKIAQKYLMKSFSSSLTGPVLSRSSACIVFDFTVFLSDYKAGF